MVAKILNQRPFRRLMLCLMGLVGVVFPAQAQTRFTIRQNAIYDQNILRNYSQANDWVSQTAVNLEHLFRVGQVELQAEYAGDLNLFYHFRDRLSHAHRIGLAAMLPVGKNIAWELETAAQLRKYQSSFDSYDYATWLARSRWQLHFWQRSPLQAGYQFRHRSYWNLPELTYSEQLVFLTIKHFFPTRTTVIGELNWGHKTFAHGAAADQMVVNTNPNSPKGRGYRHGPQKPIFHSDSTVTAYNLTAAAAELWRLSLLLAQSVFPTTGLSLQYQRQLAPSHNNRYLLGVDYFYYPNDDLFDDPYSFQSHEWEATLTQLLPWSCSLKLRTYRMEKNYFYAITPNPVTAAKISRTQRQDRQQGLGITLMTRGSLKHLAQGLSVYISVNYLSNHSNDLYFDYRGYYVDAGCGVSF